MKRSEQFRQANREAKTTVLATIVVILFWIAAGFGLADSDIVIFDTPIWVVGGCIVSWLFAVRVLALCRCRSLVAGGICHQGC